MRAREFYFLKEEGTRPEGLELMAFTKQNASQDPIAVKDLQRALMALGFNVGPTRDDGIFGPNTEAAVRAFQHKNHLSITGEPDDETVDMIAKQVFSLPKDLNSKKDNPDIKPNIKPDIKPNIKPNIKPSDVEKPSSIPADNKTDATKSKPSQSDVRKIDNKIDAKKKKTIRYNGLDVIEIDRNTDLSKLENIPNAIYKRGKELIFFSSKGELMPKGFRDPGSALNDPGFKDKLKKVAENLKVDPEALIKIMTFESKLDTQAHSSIGATGLIQFTPHTALTLKTTVGDLYDMTPTQQLDYVEKYYKNVGVKSGYGVEELYLSTFMPAALKKGNDYILGWDGDNSLVFPENPRSTLTRHKVYMRNPAFDKDKKGYFTVGDVRKTINK